MTLHVQWNLSQQPSNSKTMPRNAELLSPKEQKTAKSNCKQFLFE